MAEDMLGTRLAAQARSGSHKHLQLLCCGKGSLDLNITIKQVVAVPVSAIITAIPDMIYLLV